MMESDNSTGGNESSESENEDVGSENESEIENEEVVSETDGSESEDNEEAESENQFESDSEVEDNEQEAMHGNDYIYRQNTDTSSIQYNNSAYEDSSSESESENADYKQTIRNISSCPVKAGFSKLLSSIKAKPAKFATHGIIGKSPLPSLNIKDIGSIPLPITREQVNQMTNYLNEKECVGRNMLSFQPEGITFGNPNFISTIESIISKVKEELGCKPSDTNIEAVFQNLIVCPPGSHILYNKEVEKSTENLAKLYIQLPSISLGSKLTIWHHNKTETVQFDDKQSEFEIIYAAYHRECRVDFSPVESGYSLVLVYDMVHKSPPKISILRESESLIKKLSSALTKINHRTVKRREDDYFYNPYGWTLQHQYEPTTLQKGMDGLTGNDFALALYLQMANSKLEKKDQASFYIGKLCRWVKDEGEVGVDGKTFIANDEPVREGTKIFGAFSFDGKIRNSNFRRISFSPSIHMCTHDNQQPLFWEDKKEKINKEEYSHSSTRERWYHRYIILCLPKHSQLELFTQKEMWYESLCFIQDEIQVSSPRFKSSIKSVIEKVSSSFFKQSRYNDLDNGPFVEQEEEGLWYPDDEPLLTMTQLLVNADDVEMAKTFLRKFYAEKIDYDEKFVDKMPKSSEQALAKLLKFFQWKDLKDIIEDIISHTQVDELFRWIDISSDCGIKEITDKVINICLEKLPEFHEISTAPITSYPNGSEPYYPLWTKIFQKVFTDEYFSNLWWEKLSTCQQIISNIGLVLQFCADLPTECHSKYSIVNKFLIKCLKMRLSVDAYTPLLYAAIKPLFKDTVTYKNEIHDIFNQLLNTNNSRLVGKVLLLITEREKTYSSTEVFKSVIDLYMNWLLIAPEMTAAFDDEITFLTEIIYVRGVVIENPKKLVKICKRITDLKEFSGLIDKLFRVLPKEKEKSHCKFMTELVKVVYCALPNCTWDDTEDLCWVLTALFERGDSYHYILSKMLATEAVTLDDDIMGYTLWSLLTDPDIDIQKLKSNTNFRLLLVNYSLLLQDPQYPEPDMEPDHAYYRTVIKFLLSQPDFPLTHELLPALLQIPFYKKNWKKFLKLMTKVNLEKTETCKMLLTLAVEIFEIVLEEEKRVGRLSSVRYKAILHVFKTVFQDDFYSDIAWQLTSLQAFQINGQSNITKEKQSLEKLIRDLKEDFSQHESYARLVSIRIENLTSLYQEDQPRLHWDQPNAEFPHDENIQAFLRSEQTTYSVLGKFPDLQAAGHWIDAYCRPSFIQSHSFSGIARISNVGSVELILQKERHIYEKEKIAFRLLMEELTDLQDELRMFPKFHSKLQASGVKRKREVRL